MPKHMCEDDVDHKNICDGSKNDCVAKGKAKCDKDPNCFGVMFHKGWAKAFKGVKFCTSNKVVKKGNWMTYLKG